MAIAADQSSFGLAKYIAWGRLRGKRASQPATRYRLGPFPVLSLSHTHTISLSLSLSRLLVIHVDFLTTIWGSSVLYYSWRAR